MKRKVLLLDVDYTVINSDSMIEFFLYALKTKKLKTLVKIPYIIIMLALYVIKVIPLKKAKEAIFYPIVDFTEEELEKFFKKCIVPRINESINKVISKSKENQVFIIMVTASPFAYMKYFKLYGYANEVIGTELKYQNSRYKNLILGNNCKGKEKIIKIEEILKQEGIEIDYENSYAYSDSKHDLPMLGLVKNAYLVNKKNGEIKEKLRR